MELNYRVRERRLRVARMVTGLTEVYRGCPRPGIRVPSDDLHVNCYG